MNLQALRGAWQERAPRERRVFVAGAALLAAALFVLIAVEPARQGLARLERALPQARAQAGELAGLLAEIRTLRRLPPASAGADARGNLEKSLRDAALPPARSAMLDNGDLQYSFPGVGWARWTQWLAAAGHDLGVRAVAVRAVATSVPGNADVEVTLRLPR
jgi:type II secretory pathway component PulM